jgi:hypothetical protein
MPVEVIHWDILKKDRFLGYEFRIHAGAEIPVWLSDSHPFNDSCCRGDAEQFS